MTGCEKSEPEVRVLRPQLPWSAVATGAVGDVGEVEGTYRTLVPQGTQGAFPASLAVARLVTESQAGGPVMLDMAPANDFLPWTALTQNLRYIAETFPLEAHDLGEEPPLPENIVAAASALRAELCLVYGRGDVSEIETELRGVLYLSTTGTPLAVIHARATVLDPEVLAHPPENVEDDLRHCDPRVLAAEKFRQLVLSSIRDLRAGDRPVIPQPDDAWTPAQPFEPRIWPPPPLGHPVD
ncbi:MAG: hypothetical protein GY778_24215 [bacterium]|nr:hypothetical protein [bacterium]